MRYIGAITSAVSFAATSLAACVALAEPQLPSTLTMSSSGTSSAPYAQMVSIGNVLQNEYGTSVRLLAGDTDLARMTPLKAGRVDMCVCGITAYFGAEGVGLFAQREWGPQRLRVVVTGNRTAHAFGPATAGDIGVETPYDLKGKRIAYIRGSDSANIAMEAFLAFGGLTWDDVERVEFPSYARSFEGVIAGQADASFATTVSAPAQRLAASPRGISWPIMDPDDNEGWQRLMAVAPYFEPHKATQGAGTISESNALSLASYPYPVIVGTDDLEGDLAYGLLQAMHEHYDDYRTAAPGNEGYALDRQIMTWVMPFHDVVVQYYRDIGRWSDEMQRHQDEMVRRQTVLMDAWDDYVESAPDDDTRFRQGWMEARAEALEAAKLPVIFRN